jgi:hypothetical protein
MENVYMHLRRLFVLMVILTISVKSFSNVRDTSNPVKVAVLLPLYLDSAFNGASYKLGNNNLPKYMLPGLDFYNGVMMAIDSLEAEGQQVEVVIHDTKSRNRSISTVLNEPDLSSASFIIGSFTAKEELKKVADFAALRNIPLISATYPNDGGITNNPNLILVNPTLTTHIEGIFKYVQRNHSMDNIVLFMRKSDATDRYIMENIMESSKKHPHLPARISYVELSDVFNSREIIARLDSNKTNVVIGATLNESFAGNIARTLSSIKSSYQTSVIGMPTWDNMKALKRSDIKGVEIIYSSPYNYQRGDKNLGRLAANYNAKLNGKASDMMFKGYEAMYHFTKLFLKHDTSFIKNLSDRDFKITNEFDIQPVRTRKDTSTVDYLENKKLYYIVKMDGVIKTVK